METQRLAPALVARLEHIVWFVRKVSVEVLGKLPEKDLAKLDPELVARLAETKSHVRNAVVVTVYLSIRCMPLAVAGSRYIVVPSRCCCSLPLAACGFL